MHTPGPWARWLDEDRNRFQIYQNSDGRGFGRMIAEIVGEKGRYEANARLIAAAPALLAACEAIDDAARNAPPVELISRLDAVVAQARAAIAQARGD